ncbi:TIGR03899 family protein [Aliagarivorans taiwanensis]|uniref:TIGR03899 family protein n=1 Tax=Aliagarivorans taiwanensis TaxID=561966 RepID=UPI0003F92396|nr:TIGR03899 family protein [Aliagarivorans taiwanensis]
MAKTPNTTSSKKRRINVKQQLQEVAHKRGIDALLQESKPHSSFAQRAEYREKLEHAREQQNLERISALAMKQASDQEIGNEPDADWMTEFLRLASKTQVPAMQQLWANIWAEELRQPGSFSVKAMQTLKQMTQREAQWFQHACEMTCQVGGELNRKIVTGVMRPPAAMGWVRPKVEKLNLGQFRLPYHHILHLAELGLIYDRELEFRPNSSQATYLSINGRSHAMRPHSKGCRVTYYRFTPMGDELAKLIGDQADNGYCHQLLGLLEHFFEMN